MERSQKLTAVAGRIAHDYSPSLIRLRVGSSLVHIEVWALGQAVLAPGYPDGWHDCDGGLVYRLEPQAPAPAPAPRLRLFDAD